MTEYEWNELSVLSAEFFLLIHVSSYLRENIIFRDFLTNTLSSIHNTLRNPHPEIPIDESLYRK